MLFALHLPDHALNLETTVAATLLAVASAIVLMRKSSSVQPSLGLIAATAAFIFAVQTVNFPLLDGNTSGHLLGSAAAVLLLGPLVGCATMAAVLIAQAVLLGDGGLTALGPNLLNMALVSPLAAWGTFELVRRTRTDAVGTLLAALAAGWVASVSAAIVCAAELAVSGVGPFGTVAATLVGHHALLGLVEGIATAALVFAMMPQSIAASPAALRTMRLYPALIAAALVLACLPLASELPDTLEVVLEPQAIVAE